MIAKVRIPLALIVVAAVFLIGCATPGSYQTTKTNGHEKVYKYDEAGKKNLVYEVEKDGSLTVHDETDPRAQQLLKRQAQAEQAEVERIEIIRDAPKRQSGDPISVVLHEIQLNPDMAKAQHTKGAVMEQYMEYFENDKVIRVVNPGDSTVGEISQALRALSGKSANKAPVADIEVVSSANMEKKIGLNRKTGKVGEYAALVLTATITSNYIPVRITVTEEGNIFRNTEVMDNFTDQIKSAIKDKIGPTIPADRSL
jgi:hypothetical protein